MSKCLRVLYRIEVTQNRGETLALQRREDSSTYGEFSSTSCGTTRYVVGEDNEINDWNGPLLDRKKRRDTCVRFDLEPSPSNRKRDPWQFRYPHGWMATATFDELWTRLE